ncbi:hypothetical protein [Amycolatopsis sp. NPDC051071]|uniref:hypothetical protein n=1 Tax=Amycolatopsis sp. NPDC051071 TaxID=3154637 RepID=UPI0034224D0E
MAVVLVEGLRHGTVQDHGQCIGPKAVRGSRPSPYRWALLEAAIALPALLNAD